MSPSEDQLRAALRHGEDDLGPISADRIIARAAEIRHRRRIGVASALAAAAVVAGIGTGIGISATSGHTAASNRSAESLANGGSAPSAPNKNAAAGNAAGGAPVAGTSGAVACPRVMPDRRVPEGGETTGSFFTGPVAAFDLCLYPQLARPTTSATSRLPLHTTISGTDAAQLARSLDAAATSPDPKPCPLIRSANVAELVMTPFGTNNGAAATLVRMPPIVAYVFDNPCNQPVSNGTAVRYNWTPPPALRPFLEAALSSASAVPSTPTEKGSPATT
jgi:hypothetical protein